MKQINNIYQKNNSDGMICKIGVYQTDKNSQNNSEKGNNYSLLYLFISIKDKFFNDFDKTKFSFAQSKV